VRSDAQAPYDRQQEEQAYLLAVRQEQHGIARGLRQFAPLSVQTILLREPAPFTVRTAARFVRLDDVGHRLLAATGLAGTSILSTDGDAMEWALTIRDPRAAIDAERLDQDVAELVSDLDRLRVVLVDGRFETADGFEISNDRRVATMRPATPEGDEPVVLLRLRWR
jgi:hypothetical protein